MPESTNGRSQQSPFEIGGRLSYQQVAALVRSNNLAPVDDEVLIAIAYIGSRFNADDKTPGPTATPIGMMQVSDIAMKQLVA